MVLTTYFFIILGDFNSLYTQMRNGYSDDYYDRQGQGQADRDEIFSKAVKAGKRTYFIDVKATRNEEYYLTITESKKRLDRDGGMSYEKHKIFLYKEDFDKFLDGMSEVIDFVKSKQEVVARDYEGHNHNYNNDYNSTDYNNDFNGDYSASTPTPDFY